MNFYIQAYKKDKTKQRSVEINGNVANGHAKSNGVANGHAKANGQVKNGYTNGNTNGHIANGHTYELTETHANHSLTNGHVNGDAIGKEKVH